MNRYRYRYRFFLLILMLNLSLAGCIANKKNENKELTFYIVRHGKTMLNSSDRVQGWSDAVLIKSGEEVVRKAGIGMKDIEFQNVYSSDSGRAVQTASILLNENVKSKKITPVLDERLREINFGTYEGDLNINMWKEIAKLNKITVEEFKKNATPKMFADSVAYLDKKRALKFGESYPAEDYDTASKRLKSFIEEIANKESKQKGSGNILVTSHGLAICTLLDSIDNNFIMPAGGVKNASVSVIKYIDGKFIIDRVNDLRYIENKS